MSLHLPIHASEQAWYVDYAFNSSCINWKQNKTHIHCKKNKADFTAANIGIRHRNFSLNFGHRKFYVNCPTLTTMKWYANMSAAVKWQMSSSRPMS